MWHKTSYSAVASLCFLQRQIEKNPATGGVLRHIHRCVGEKKNNDTIVFRYFQTCQHADTTFWTGKNSFTYDAKLACNLPDNEMHVYFRVPVFEEGETPFSLYELACCMAPSHERHNKSTGTRLFETTYT